MIARKVRVLPKLRVVSGGDAVKVFKKVGWAFDRQKGSQAILKKPGSKLVLSVPLHDELDRGLLRHLIRVAGMTVDEFLRLLER